MRVQVLCWVVADSQQIQWYIKPFFVEELWDYLNNFMQSLQIKIPRALCQAFPLVTDCTGLGQEGLLGRNTQWASGSAAESCCTCHALLAMTVLSASPDCSQLHFSAGQLARTCTEVPVIPRHAGGGINLLNAFPNFVPLEEFKPIPGKGICLDAEVINDIWITALLL